MTVGRLLRQMRMRTETRTETQRVGREGENSLLELPWQERAVTLREFSGQLFHQYGVFTKTPKPPADVQIFTACPILNRGKP